MKMICISILVALAFSLAAPAEAQSGSSESAWRTLAGELDGGATVDLRLRDGAHFKATFIAAQASGVLLQRKTRIPVAVEEIAYDSIASMSLAQTSSLSGGKVAAIALGSAGAAIGALFLILLAAFD